MTARAASHQTAAEYSFGGRFSATATLDEERREVFEGVLESLRIQEPDADRIAACSYLLRHLARTKPRDV
jgi:hypothetical protein